MPLLQFAGSELNPTLRLSNQWGPGPTFVNRYQSLKPDWLFEL